MADGIVLGSDHGRWSYWRKVATVKRSCKPAATSQGFPTSTQPQLDHPDLRCDNIIHSTTKKHTAHTILWIWESITTSCICSPARQILEPSLKRHHQFTEHIAGTWPTQGHTQSYDLGESGSWGFWSYGSMERAIWTRENDVGKVFPCEDQGGRGITVAVASGVATWLHCGRSPPGI